MKRRFTTDHPSDPDRARIQAASDRCSRETTDEPVPTLQGELTQARTACTAATRDAEAVAFGWRLAATVNLDPAMRAMLADNLARTKRLQRRLSELSAALLCAEQIAEDLR